MARPTTATHLPSATPSTTNLQQPTHPNHERQCSKGYHWLRPRPRPRPPPGGSHVPRPRDSIRQRREGGKVVRQEGHAVQHDGDEAHGRLLWVGREGSCLVCCVTRPTTATRSLHTCATPRCVVVQRLQATHRHRKRQRQRQRQRIVSATPSPTATTPDAAHTPAAHAPPVLRRQSGGPQRRRP